MATRMIGKRISTWGGLMAAALSISALCAAAFVMRSVPAVSAEPASSSAPGRIGFVGKNTIATANGTFKSWRFSSVQIDRAHPENSVVEIEIDVESLDTGIKKRDDHLRTADFFDVAKYPKAKVKIYDAKPKEKQEGAKEIYAANMDLDIHGVKKTMDFEFTVLAMDPLEIEGKVTLSRTAFGVGSAYSKINPMSIQDEIPVTFGAKVPIK